jgi:hypothetical protein
MCLTRSIHIPRLKTAPPTDLIYPSSYTAHAFQSFLSSNLHHAPASGCYHTILNHTNHATKSFTDLCNRSFTFKSLFERNGNNKQEFHPSRPSSFAPPPFDHTGELDLGSLVCHGDIAAVRLLVGWYEI